MGRISIAFWRKQHLRWNLQNDYSWGKEWEKSFIGRVYKIRKDLGLGKSRLVWISQWIAGAKKYWRRNTPKMRLKRQVLYYIYSEISLYCKANSDSADFPAESNLCCTLSVDLKVCHTMFPRNVSSSIAVQQICSSSYIYFFVFILFFIFSCIYFFVDTF